MSMTKHYVTSLRKAKRVVRRIQRNAITSAKRGGNNAIPASEYFEQARVCRRSLSKLARLNARRAHDAECRYQNALAC